MHRIHELWAALVSAAFTVLALPALVLAQGGTQTAPANPPPGGGGLPSSPATGGGSSSWLWILIALAVVAVIWYALSARRTATRTR